MSLGPCRRTSGPFHPALARLEYELKAYLGLTAIQRCYCTRLGSRQCLCRIAKCIGRNGQAVDLVNAVNVEKIQELCKELEFVPFRKRNEPRISKIDIELLRRCAGVPRDTDRIV